jgi:cobalt-precorrin 5A hydrolase
MRAEIAAFTHEGLRLGQKTAAFLAGAGYEARCRRVGRNGISLAQWTREAFSQADALIFIGAAGIAVRAIAPHLKSKTSDPAVLVMDDAGRFCIPLLAGHIGGANALALELAEITGATPVITTATDIHGVFAVDTWAVRQGLAIRNPESVKTVSAALLHGDEVTFKIEFPIEGSLPKGLTDLEKPARLLIGIHLPERPALHLVPRVVIAGVGCKKGISEDAVAQAVSHALEASGFVWEALAKVCSIDIKATEPGLVSFCRRHGLPFETFAASALAALPGCFTASAFVAGTVGADNVCERSAVLGGGRLISRKHACNGVTVALSIMDYTVRFGEMQWVSSTSSALAPGNRTQ